MRSGNAYLMSVAFSDVESQGFVYNLTLISVRQEYTLRYLHINPLFPRDSTLTMWAANYLWQYRTITWLLIHWGKETHICIGNLTTIGSDDGLSPCQSHVIIWNNAGILLIEPLGTKFNEIWSDIHAFSFKKMHLKMWSAKWRQFYLGLIVLMPEWHKEPSQQETWLTTVKPLI